MRRGLRYLSKGWLGFRRGPIGWIASIVMGLVTIAVIGGVFLAWRIGSAPVSLAFAIPAIEAALTPADRSFSVQLQGFSLRRDQLDFVLEAQGLSLFHTEENDKPESVPFATMPIARISLSIAALLQDGVLAANRIVASGWKMAAARGPDGVELKFANDAGDTAEGLPLAAIRRLLRDDPRLHHLKSVELTDLTFRINDPVLGIAWETRSAWMQLINDGNGLSWGGRMVVAAQTGDLTKVLKEAGTIRWSVDLPQSKPSRVLVEPPDPSKDRAVLRVDLVRLEPSLIIDLLPRLQEVVRWEGTVSGTATTEFSLRAVPANVLFDLTVGAGRMRLPLTGGDLVFESAGIAGRVDLIGRALTVRRLSVNHTNGETLLSGQGHLDPEGGAAVTLSASGLNLPWLGRIVPEAKMLDGADLNIAAQIDATIDPTGKIVTASADLSTRGGTLTLPQKLLEPLPIGKSSLRLSVSDAGQAYTLDRLSISLPRPHGKPDVKVDVAGAARLGGEGALTIKTGDLDERDLKRLWPIGVGEGARVWVVDQVHKGFIPQADIDTTFRLPASATLSLPTDIRIDGRMPLRNVDLTYWPPLPMATGLNATARITEKLFEADVSSGSSGGVAVRGGHLIITGIDKGKGYERTALSFDLEGPLAKLMTVLDRPPLRFARFLELPPSQLGGRIAGTLTAKFPPIAELSLADIELGATGSSEGTVIPQAAFRQDLTDGRFSFKVSKNGLLLRGQGAMAGAPLDLEGDMKFASTASYRSKFRLRAILPDQVKASLGLKEFPFSKEIVSGPVSVDFTATETKAAGTTIKVAADLTKARKALPLLGWVSPPGEYAAASAQVRVVGGKLRQIDSFRVTGSKLTLVGDAKWPSGDDARPVVRISQLRHGAGTDLAIQAVPLNGGGYQLGLSGDRLDARRLIKTVTDDTKSAADDDGDPTPITANLKIGSVKLGSGPPVQTLSGRIQIAGSEVQSVALNGRTAGGGAAQLKVNPNRTVTLSSDDAGALLASVGVTERLQHGALKIQGELPKNSSDIRGKVTLEGGKLNEAPFMMRLLSGRNLGQPKSENQWSINRMDSDFALEKGLLSLDEGRVFGGELGITFRGWVDLNYEKLDIGGAIVPAYSVNRILSAIPLIGEVLTGGDGLFAANFRATGDLAEPEFSINPLTALAPGLLRKLFGGDPSRPPQP